MQSFLFWGIKIMKKSGFVRTIISFFLSAVLIFGTTLVSVPAFAADAGSADASTTPSVVDVTAKYKNAPTVDVRVNGKLVKWPDAKPFIDENNRTLVPVAVISKVLGAAAQWNGATKTATLTLDGVKLSIPLGKKEITVEKNGVSTTQAIDTMAVIRNDRTMVPARVIADAFGAWVGYSSYYKTVLIYKDVLSAAEINALHAIPDADGFENKRPDVFSGPFCFENQNECINRDPNFTTYTLKSLVVKNNYDGTTWQNGKDPAEDRAILVTNYIRSAMAEDYSFDLCGVTATFRTDESCTFVSKTTVVGDTVYNNRGYLTITLAPDADVAGYKSMNSCAEFGNIQAGHSYTYTMESAWQVMVRNGHSWFNEIGVANLVNGTYENWGA